MYKLLTDFLKGWSLTLKAHVVNDPTSQTKWGQGNNCKQHMEKPLINIIKTYKEIHFNFEFEVSRNESECHLVFTCKSWTILHEQLTS